MNFDIVKHFPTKEELNLTQKKVKFQKKISLKKK